MNELPQIRALLAEIVRVPNDEATVLRAAFLIRCKLDAMRFKVDETHKQSFTDRLFHYLDNQIKEIANRP